MSTTLNITVSARNFSPQSAPILEIKPTTMYHVEGKNYQEYGVLCYHNHTGDLTDRRLLKPTMSPIINSSTPVGTYKVTYEITNDKGTTKANRIIIVVKRPTITCVGSPSINRYVGEPLNDPGYTIDNKGVMIEPVVKLLNGPLIDEYGNIKTAGTYHMTYFLSYGAQFPSFTDRTFTREFIVKNKKPTITLNPTIVYWKEGVIYNDSTAGAPVTTDTVSITTDPLNLNTISGAVNTTQKIVYTVKNWSGETATATRFVRFIQEPTLTLKGNAIMNMNKGDIWIDPGYDAKDAFGNTSYEVGITGVPTLDNEKRVITTGEYIMTYTLRVSNTPNTQIVKTRTVNVMNPIKPPPILTVLPKRVYHRHRDTYTDNGVSAKTYDNVVINAGNSVGTLQTTSITRKYEGNSTLIGNIGDIKNLVGEYIITYEVTHDGITVKDTRYVDVYSDLLDYRNFQTSMTTPTSRYNAGVKITNHTVSSIQVHNLPGISVNQRIFCNKSLAPCNNTKPFTFMTWIRIAAKETQGSIILLKTSHFTISLEIKNNVYDYFNGSKTSNHVKVSIYGPAFGDTFLKTMNTSSPAAEYPFIFRDDGRGVYTNMHDCPRVGEWFSFSLQYDGSSHFIMSLNGIRHEYTLSYYQEVYLYEMMLADSNNNSGGTLEFDICNTSFIYRFLHIHEIQELYEYFVLNNTDMNTRYASFGSYLNEVENFMDKFKAGTNNSTDNTAFESALRNIRIIGHCALQKSDGSHLNRALQIISKFEREHGPLFVGLTDDLWQNKIGTFYQPRYDYYGFAPYQHSNAQLPEHQLNTHRLVRGMIFFHQIVWDAGLQANTPYRHYYISSEYGISFASELRTKELQILAEKCKWGTATHIKGQTTNVTDTEQTMSIVLKIRNRKVSGIPGDYIAAPATRCTGMWLSRGVISHVTVPDSMVNMGIQLCVGEHKNDTSLFDEGHVGGRYTRMDRVAAYFLIDQSTVRVYNPLGGNLYVLVPYGIDIGMVTLTATNVVPSRIFRIVDDDVTGFHQETSKAEWNAIKNVASGGPPTVDIETDYTLLHIPSQWIEENVEKHNWLTEFPGNWTIYDRIKDLALKYDSICKSILFFRQTPGLDAIGAVDHPMIYNSVDMAARCDGGVGWPMVNSPIIASHTSNHWITNWCIDDLITWHEIGHMYCNRAYGFSNEGECSNEVLLIFLYHQLCGYNLNDAFYATMHSGESVMSLDESVVDWMKEDIFVNGTQMTADYGGYQKRGWHKYVDIVALVGWEGFIAYQRAENEAFNRQIFDPPTPMDNSDAQRIVRMSLALGIDMAPLMEFWGITDNVPGKENDFRTNVRTIIERDLMGKTSTYFKPYGRSDMQQNCPVHKCRGVRKILLYFKSLIPRTNLEALEHVWSTWKMAYPVSSGSETLKMTNASPNYKYLGWWEKFFITDNKKWDSVKISAIEARIDAILAAHGLTNEPAPVAGCIACANNNPNFNPTPKIHPSWAIMPTKSRVNRIPYRTLTFYVTEDALGFIVKGERDHKGSLPADEKMPVLNARFLTKFIFHVSTITPFYIFNENGQKIEDERVKNQGTTKGLLIWFNTEYNHDCYYGSDKISTGAKTNAYKNMIKKIFGPV